MPCNPNPSNRTEAMILALPPNSKKFKACLKYMPTRKATGNADVTGKTNHDFTHNTTVLKNGN